LLTAGLNEKRLDRHRLSSLGGSGRNERSLPLPLDASPEDTLKGVPGRQRRCRDVDRRRVLRHGLTAFDRHRLTNVIDQLANKE
jgi:hypothetical protein